ncbi:MAG: hypothetical protein KatS3mg103_1259 [Phycisphaerales bacterium]|nr:MAG: hypothetical protein KatS3mg103_1259 [Phycisphaerales bacterium]
MAASRGATAAGAAVQVIRLRDYPLPIYDQEIEDQQGLPENCLKLKALFKAHHGMIIGCPEYNSTISGALKNVVDWVSRPREGEAPLECFDRKVIGLVSASPGALGGIRGLPTERTLFGHIKAIVLPDQFALPGCDKAFDDQGQPQGRSPAGDGRGRWPGRWPRSAAGGGQGDRRLKTIAWGGRVGQLRTLGASYARPMRNKGRGGVAMPGRCGRGWGVGSRRRRAGPANAAVSAGPGRGPR